MASRAYKAIELAFHSATPDAEAEQAMRIARKFVKDNNLGFTDLLKAGGHQTNEGPSDDVPQWHPPHESAGQKVQPKPSKPRAPRKPRAPKAPRAPDEVPRATKAFPKQYPYQCHYRKSIYTKATARADAIKRLHSEHSNDIVEYTYDKKIWVFALKLDEDTKQQMYSQYSGSEDKWKGPEKDILVRSYTKD